MSHIDQSKYPPPENWLYTEARRLFTAPDVTPASEIDLKWEKPDEEGLVAYMCGEKGFSEDRIRNGCKKLSKARGGATQGRLDSFFKVKVTVYNLQQNVNNVTVRSCPPRLRTRINGRRRTRQGRPRRRGAPPLQPRKELSEDNKSRNVKCDYISGIVMYFNPTPVRLS